MKKYEVRFCSCGHIHLIPTGKIDNAIENDKELLFICGDCGAAVLIGAEKEYDFDTREDCYMMYSYDFSSYDSKEITKESFGQNDNSKAISEVYYSHGIKIPMMNGFYATFYQDGIFYDNRLIFNMYEIDRPDVTAEEVQKFIKRSKEEMKTVNMRRFISENSEDVLEEISNYYIKGLDWTGTKYKKNYN